MREIERDGGLRGERGRNGDMNGCHFMGVSKNRGTPEWMIYNGNPY